MRRVGDMRYARRVLQRRRRVFTVADPYPAHAGDGGPFDWDFWSSFADCDWEPELDAVLEQHLPGRCLVDVGAWWGPVSLIGAQVAEWVYAAEPDPVAAAWFAENRKLCGASNVTVTRRAVRGDGDAPVRLQPARSLGDSMTRASVSAAGRTVTAWTLQQLFHQLGIVNAGLIKIDIEGAEVDVLPHAAPFLGQLGCPLLLSLHDPLMADPAGYAATIEAALSGFDVAVLSGTYPGGLSTLLVTP